jgi:guanylate kinase
MSHPEVKRLLNDYLSNILLHKPDDVFKFTKDYFKFLSDKGESDKFVVLVGPNSVGKTTLINKICEDFPENFETPKHIVTNNKENCINVSKEEFMDGINNKTIIVYSYDNKENEYEGISKEEIDRINNSGKIAILEIDLKGAKTINNSSVDANFIGVLPPSMDALRVRIKQNTKLNTASINNVLEFAEKEVKEIENLTFFGFRIMNDELETGYKDMKNAIISLYPFLKYKPEDIEAIKNGNFGREEE